ncbi:uncharacterized protein LOC131952183 [Physella acuta]|uniref:uncharacterized protein LOC131952183 n=1 Tax=Physella acuta TaxID=109671 RepID=UPI0027DDFD82|nr:uncharacterized protein LOC131952183 [Physella acuta]
MHYEIFLSGVGAPIKNSPGLLDTGSPPLAPLPSRAVALVSLESFCRTDPLEMFSLSPGSTFDLKTWINDLCHLNFTQVEEQLASYKTAKNLENIISGSPNDNTNLMTIIDKVDKIVQKLQNGVSMTEQFLNVSLWTQVISRLQRWVGDYTVFNSPLMYLDGIFELIGSLSERPDTAAQLKPLLYVGEITDNLLDAVLSLENKSSIGAVDLVGRWTAMQKLLEFIQMPNVIDVFISSITSENFLTLFYNRSALEDFCNPSTSASKYLVVPKSRNIDLQEIKTAFCAIDINNFMDQFDTFFDIQKLERVVEGTEKLDWSKLQEKFRRMIFLINDKWLKDPPHVDLPQQLMDRSYWEHLLQDSIQPLQDGLMTKNQLESIIRQLGPLLEMDEFKQAGAILNSLLDIINENLVALQGNTLTFGNVLEKIPALRSLFSALGLDQSTLEAVMLAPVNNLTKLVELLLSGTRKQDFCSVDPWREILQLPSSFSTSGLFAAVCQDNVAPMLDKLQENYNLQTMLEALGHNPVQSQDWGKVVEKVYAVVDNIKALISSPPMINTDAVLEKLAVSYTNTTGLWSMLKAYNTLQQAFINDATFTKSFSGVLRVSGVLLDLLNELMARTKLQNRQLDLASLFSDVPEFVSVVNGVLDVKPDPVSGLFAVQLKPAEVDMFIQIIQSPALMAQLACNNTKFNQIFQVREDVNINSLLHVLCGLDFGPISEKLKETFRVNSLGNEVMTAWNAGTALDVERFASQVQLTLEHITNLTKIDSIFFKDHDLGDILRVNVTRLLEELNSQFTNIQGAVSADYLPFSVSILNQLLHDMQNLTEIKSLTAALKFTQAYLNSFNNFLKSIQDVPISVAALLNNTEIGRILNPILNDPHILDGLVHSTLDVRELYYLVTNPFADAAVCGDQLWEAFQMPENEARLLYQVQQSACTANQSLLLWQTVMMQANGFLLYKQLEYIQQEMDLAQSSLNVSGVADEMTQAISLIENIIKQYQNGSRQVFDLINVQGFQEVLNAVQKSIAQKLMDSSKNWSISIAELVLPQIMDDISLQSYAKTVNTANLFMSVIIGKLQRIRNGTISLSSLLTDADGLSNMIETYVRLGKTVAQAWIDGQFQIPKMLQIFTNSTRLELLCKQPDQLSAELGATYPPGQAVSDLSTLVCSVLTESLQKEVLNFVSYDYIQNELTAIWTANTTSPNYEKFISNVEEFTNTITDLANKSLTVSNSLTGSFNFSLDAFKNIATNPQLIIRLMKLFGIALEGPLHQAQDVVQALSGINTFAVMPVVNILDALKAKGITLQTIANNPETLLEVLSTLVDMDVQFSVMETVWLKPQLNYLLTHRGNCNNTMYEETLLTRGVADLKLPVPWQQVYTVLCQSQDAGVMLQKMKEMGLTYIQITVLLNKMFPADQAETLDQMYDQNFGWIDLMSSIERLTSLATQAPVNQSQVTSVKSAWEAIQDTVFDKSLNSLFSYLQLLESETGTSDDWIKFRQFLQFFNASISFIDENLSKFGQGVELKDILPNTDKVSSIIEELFGDSAAELLATSINPILFYRITLREAWAEMCDGYHTLEAYFDFPTGTDVALVQSNLCRAVLSNSTSFQMLLQLFNAGEMLVELDKLIHGDYIDAALNTSVWEAAYSSIKHLIDTAQSLQNVDTTTGLSWLTTVADKLSSLLGSESYRLTGMCNSLVRYLNNTDGYYGSEQSLSIAITALNLVTDLSKLIPELDELACILVSNNEVNIAGLIDRITYLGFFDDIKKTIDSLYEPSGVVDCVAPVYDIMRLMERINHTLTYSEVNGGQMSECLTMAGGNFRDMLGSFSKTLMFTKDLLGFMQTPPVQNMLADPRINPIMDFIIDSINSTEKVVLTFADLLQDGSIASDFLINKQGIPSSIADAFLNATVSKDWIHFLHNPVNIISEYLCSVPKLSDIISLSPGSSATISNISRALCHLSATEIAGFLQNFSQPINNINNMASSKDNQVMDVITEIVPEIADIFLKFSDVIGLSVNFFSYFNMDLLKRNVFSIDKLLLSDTISSLANSFQKIMDGLKNIIPKTPDTENVLKDVQVVLNGVFGLDIVRIALLQQTHVKELLNDPQAVESYLKTLGFSEDIIQALLDAVYSSRVLFNLVSKPAHSCVDVLSMLIFVNSTVEDKQSIVTSLCRLNTTQIQELVARLIPEVNAGDLISKYVNNTGNFILESVNMTSAQLKSMVTQVDKGLSNLQKASTILQENSNSKMMMNIFTNATASASTNLDKMATRICGRDLASILSFPSNPAFALSAGSGIEEQLEQGTGDQETDLPNEFCLSFYQVIRESSLGSLIWAYVKPILRGKILYTPDNPATRAILAKANKTFSDIEELNRISKLWATKADGLQSLLDLANDTEDLRHAMDNDFIKSIVEASSGLTSAALTSSLDALQSNSIDASQLNALKTAAEVISNYSSCILTNRFQPVASEQELEEQAFRLSQTRNYLAGIVFLNLNETDTTQGRKRRQAGDIHITKHVAYKIRMDVDNVMDTNFIKSYIWKMAAESNFIEDLRYLRGFIYLQDIIDKAIIDTHKDQSVTTPGFNIKQMPYPCHHEDNFIVMLGAYMIPVVMTFVFITSIGVATHNLVCDRENGQEENLRVMGMISGLNFLAWLASTMVLLTVVCVVIAIMLYYTNIFIYSNMLIIFLYLVDFCFSSVMLLYLVSSFFTRTTMAILFVMVFFMIAYIPYVIVIGLGLTMTYWQKMLTSFASTTAFCFGSLRLSYLEENGIGVQWSNVNEYYGTDLTMSWSCYMMLIDSAIYFLIGWYVRNVMPGQYGIPQPFYFPFLPSYWFGCTQPTKAISQDAGSYQPGPLFEAPPVGFNVGISIVNLCKTYSNKKQALRNLSLNMYENQITTLLGHNGAAKTTTMKLICGVLKPTSGEVLINGKKTGCFSSSLGVCPQQNALFLHMTVREHMSFYAGIKGSKNKIETLKETRSLLQDVDLWHARNVTARNLSYGMKRRLCVALAFVGGSKTVILDEPTSGVDPHARKHIWNLITKNRPGRTILLSTHHLDEADFLSDRIAVMHQGRLLSCGSPSFLKWSVGEGFNLTLVKKANVSMIEGAQPEMNEQSAHNSVVLTFIQSMCPKASLIEQIGSELTFNLPRDPTSMQVPFDEFFRKLDLNLNQLNVESYGLSDTTLEDVFFKLTEEADSANQSNVSSPAIISKHRRSPLEFDDLDDIGNSTESVSKQERLTGLSLLFTQMAALLIKRLHHYRRNWRILVSALLLPIIFLVFGLGFASVRLDESNMKALVLDASMYGPDSYAFFQDSVKNNISKRFVQTLTNTEVGFGTACMKDDLSRKFFDEDKCASPSPWYNYTKPMFMVGCRNAHQIFTKMPLPYVINERRMPPGEYLQDLSQWNILSYLLRTFDEYKEHRFGGWSFESADVGSATAVDPHVWFTTKGYHAMPSYFNSLSNTVLRSQLPAGEDPTEYGITTINHPIRLGRAPLSVKNLVGEASDAGLAVVIVVAYSFIPCGIILYIINEKVFKERQLQSISGIGVVVYWTVAFFWDLVLYSVSAAIGIAVVVIFQKDSFVIRDNLAAFSSILLLYGWANIPSLYCVGRLFNKGSTAYLVLFCLNLFLALCTIISLLVMLLYREVEVVVQIYNVCKHLYLIFPQYALGQGLMDLASNTVIYKLFMRFGDDRYKNPFSFDVIGWKLVALGIEGLFFFILTLLLDGLSWPALRVPGNRRKADYDYEDEDVARERDRILHGSNNDMLIVDNLSKVYRRNWRKFLAVNHISFGVPEGECFGLLGVNGAGKTTTFRMLTGDNKASGGSVMLKGERMTSNQHFGQNVGYCPQEGGLDEYLTAEEMLYFHARLRGFKTEQRKILVNDLLTKLCLTQYAHKAIHTYSGGTKRKLALAVALLGNPPIVYLDEPTTGMDVGTRRQAWRCIAQANRNGQSVVLTSHSMDECDALCSTIAIMVNGVIKCIGSPQHLKHKYGDGYTVIIHTGEDQLHTVTQNFLFKFPGSVIKAIHHSSVELRVPQPMCVVADILGYLQHARDDKAIEYYSLSQTTLDSVFISFAQEQTDNYVLDSSLSEDSSSEDSLSKDPTQQEFVNSAFTDDNQAVPNFYATNLQLAGDPEVYVSKL